MGNQADESGFLVAELASMTARAHHAEQIAAAVRAGLPPEAARYLRGADLAEIEADAAELADTIRRAARAMLRFPSGRSDAENYRRGHDDASSKLGL